MGVCHRIHTAYWNAMGMPVIALPIGFTSGADPLPLSAQIAAPPFVAGVALRLAQAYQRVTAWHLAEPPLAKSGLHARAQR